MKEYNFLAFDIGATSGRAVLGTLKDAKFEMKEIHRFPNPMVELHGRFYWDIYHLYTSLIESLTICARQRIRLHSIGIDTWGVDFGYVAFQGGARLVHTAGSGGKDIIHTGPFGLYVDGAYGM